MHSPWRGLTCQASVHSLAQTSLSFKTGQRFSRIFCKSPNPNTLLVAEVHKRSEFEATAKTDQDKGLIWGADKQVYFSVTQANPEPGLYVP